MHRREWHGDSGTGTGSCFGIPGDERLGTVVLVQARVLVYLETTEAGDSSTGTGSCFGIPGDERLGTVVLVQARVLVYLETRGWGQWYRYRLVFWYTWRRGWGQWYRYRLMFWYTWRREAGDSGTGTGSCFGIPGDDDADGWLNLNTENEKRPDPSHIQQP
ncbi:uncharacterized protein HD556DRAFT_1306561 [Suillus plorans]|uniref:Uncharacterized protein n=1 Tax=Suillus plorans TaxID=116603 RepID=A0A9P7DKY8_9AGAM|nr:uncharacterized protein HD556DRAFT_1306561 [Suillus plorans]KAG1797410.1 hypothetical protein HD556DRAFT_1306561 [Suillus plorans]